MEAGGNPKHGKKMEPEGVSKAVKKMEPEVIPKPVAIPPEARRKDFKKSSPFKLFFRDYVAALNADQLEKFTKEQIRRLAKLAWHNLPPTKRIQYVIMLRRKVGEQLRRKKVIPKPAPAPVPGPGPKPVPIPIPKPRRPIQPDASAKRQLRMRNRPPMSNKSREAFDRLILSRLPHWKK